MLRCACLLGISGLYCCDVMHCWSILRKRKLDEESIRFDNDEWETLRKSYLEDNCVSRDDFEKRLGYESDGGDRIVERESCIFIGGGRAAMLQLAHPYVASAIHSHSNISRNGVQKRFFRTFKYMFPMIFGESDEGIRAARTVRKLHDDVFGEIDEDLGIFKRGDRYSANHGHALYWVQMTLVDSALFMFELLVEGLGEEEKDGYIRNSNAFVEKMFGVACPPYNTYRSYLEHLVALSHSDIIVVGTRAKEVGKLLWRGRLALPLVRWLTFVMLPDRVGRGFYGRVPSLVEQAIWCLVFGLIRFVYRLLPVSFRWLSAYVYSRRGSSKASILSSFSACLANVLLKLVM
mmetsp:Transcript_14122/g.23084  ORF Transcript_14122/g.23084 Transcript_14122/m.23084 type:complete len:348 (+) Transcript_14122:191-1234(+)